MAKKELLEVKIGDFIKGKFRKYGVHTIVGEVWDITKDAPYMPGTWITIRVSGGNMNDPQVSWMASNKVNCLIPLKDVMEVVW